MPHLQVFHAYNGPSTTTNIIALNRQGQPVAGQLTYAVQQAGAPTVVVHATFVIDVSFSMADKTEKGRTRLDTVLWYIRDMATKFLEPTDRLTLAFFDVGYHQVWHNTPVANVLNQFDRVASEAQRWMAESRGTAVWDNTLKALSSMQKTESGDKDHAGNTVLRFLITFTDGDDNRSTCSLGETVRALRAPGIANFNYVALCVGSQKAAIMMQDACEGVKHINVISEAGCSAREIEAVFRTAKQRMHKTKQALVEVLTLRIVNNTKGAKASMPDLLSQFGSLQLGGSARQVAFTDPGEQRGRGHGRSTSQQRGSSQAGRHQRRRSHSRPRY
ncbi:hypothetical protein V8C86DRAFT_2704222 [Haematococcus lacustris]